MGFKDRLSRLGPGAPLSPGERARAGEEILSPAAEPVLGGDPLATLRAKMAAMVSASAERIPPSNAPLSVDLDSTLPFVTIERPEGPLAQRVWVQRLSATVGRMPLGAAATSDADMLSLLALDPALSSCDPRRLLYFDTETTGLGGAGALAFLVGLGWFDEAGCFVLEQLLLSDPSQEPALLGRFRELLEGASGLVSFNGKSFDWPLLSSRCVMNRLAPFGTLPHLDLLHLSRRVHKRRLARFRLKDLETEVLGWDRGEDDIPGAEIPPRYGHYLRTGDGEALLPVIEHNAYDVLTMAALVGLYGEPVEQLKGEDLLGLAETLTRAKAYEYAQIAADMAMDQGHGVAGLSVRARLHKARGDKARALLDFEALSEQVDDPKVRLELAKLFEHHAGDFERALAVLDLGTGEEEEAQVRRRTRLLGRSARKKAPRS